MELSMSTCQVHDERIYTFIVAFIRDHGRPPRRNDITEAIGCTVRQLDYALRRLRAQGWIREHSLLPLGYRRAPLSLATGWSSAWEPPRR